MKLETTDTSIKLIPETTQEQQAMHDIKYRGIQRLQIVGLQSPRQDLVLTLGTDYIQEARDTDSGQAEESQAALQTGNQLLGLGLCQGNRMAIRAAVVYLFDRPSP